MLLYWLGWLQGFVQTWLDNEKASPHTHSRWLAYSGATCSFWFFGERREKKKELEHPGQEKNKTRHCSRSAWTCCRLCRAWREARWEYLNSIGTAMARVTSLTPRLKSQGPTHQAVPGQRIIPTHMSTRENRGRKKESSHFFLEFYSISVWSCDL